MGEQMSKEKELVELLQAKTLAGTISWEPTAVDDEFVASVAGGASIFVRTVSPREPSDDTPDVIFTLKDKDDRTIFSIYNGQADIEYRKLMALHEVGRRSALKIDAAIESILQDLKRQD
jgi:hypothetical protein